MNYIYQILTKSDEHTVPVAFFSYCRLHDLSFLPPCGTEAANRFRTRFVYEVF
jgi:hypothetical protein